MALTGAGFVQGRLWWQTTETNLARWWRGEQVAYPQSVPMRDALLWVRDHLPREAVFVADAFTSRHHNATAPVVVDNTSIDKHYYYTAWAARRFWLEGTPTSNAATKSTGAWRRRMRFSSRASHRR